VKAGGNPLALGLGGRTGEQVGGNVRGSRILLKPISTEGANNGKGKRFYSRGSWASEKHFTERKEHGMTILLKQSNMQRGRQQSRK